MCVGASGTRTVAGEFRLKTHRALKVRPMTLRRTCLPVLWVCRPLWIASGVRWRVRCLTSDALCFWSVNVRVTVGDQWCMFKDTWQQLSVWGRRASEHPTPPQKALTALGASLLLFWTLKIYFELENTLSTHLLAWLLILVRLSEIKYIALRVPFSGTWSLSLLWISYYSWVFPDTLDGVEQRRCWAHIGDCFEPHQVICEGFLSLPRERLQLATLVDCLWLGGSPSCE